MNLAISLSFLLLLISHAPTFAQQEQSDTTVYIIVDKYPVLLTDGKEYQLAELKNFIHQHLEYPDNGNDCTGAVYISFIVEKGGTISNKKYVRRLCPGFDENAMKVIDLMKNWKPGIKDGKVVKTKIIVPVRWMLE